MNNLTPAVGELNADRSNYNFATIAGEKRAYGQCDFEVDFKSDTAEPGFLRKRKHSTYLFSHDERAWSTNSKHTKNNDALLG
ncbi:MAG: hypothetical protein HAW66_04755 [Shewanella sp.]|nr:hypothetical protein [Shewanella sp.]